MDKQQLAKMIDHTILKPEADKASIEKLCKEALEYNFASVCINPTNVELAAKLLKGSEVKVCTVIGFPLGANTMEVKAFETKDAIAKGADEVDMVINIGRLKDKDYEYVEKDIKAVVDAADKKALTKVIIETCLLTEEEKVKACELTGFSTGGATPEDIKLMRETVGPEMGVKASGGVRSIEDAEAVIKNGATRIGASASIAICEGKVSDSTY